MKTWMGLIAVALMSLATPAWAVGDQDLAREAAKAAGVTQAQARAVIDAMKESIFTHLKAGEEVRLKGMGKFYVKHRDAHKARNPKTGKEVEVPAKNHLRFKPYDSAHARLN